MPKPLQLPAIPEEGVDPYNTARTRRPVFVTDSTEEQRKEADAILACFEATLSTKGEGQ